MQKYNSKSDFFNNITSERGSADRRNIIGALFLIVGTIFLFMFIGTLPKFFVDHFSFGSILGYIGFSLFDVALAFVLLSKGKKLMEKEILVKDDESTMSYQKNNFVRIYPWIILVVVLIVAIINHILGVHKYGQQFGLYFFVPLVFFVFGVPFSIFSSMAKKPWLYGALNIIISLGGLLVLIISYSTLKNP